MDSTKKNRTNPAEAKAIINILFEQIHPNENGEYPSIGIATFNINQRNLILEMLQDECYLNQKASGIHEKLRENGLFIKNLENIQGDERDIIIISTTFGLNAEGKFRQNFGPINQLKGYKLLNVIITRAKHRLYVCTSIPPDYYARYKEEISARGNIGKGLFYTYLAYAKSIEEGDSETRLNILNLLGKNCVDGEPTRPLSFVESPFEQEVYDYLTDHLEKGRIDIQYEFGGFRIDFVIKSKSDGKPIIAIECDGATYHSSEEAYAHDMYRQKLIERNMGLKFYRIWSTNWWIDPHKEIQKLVKFIQLVDKKDEKRVTTGEHVTLGEGLRFTDDPLSITLQEEILTTIETEPSRKVVTIDSTVKIKNIHDGKTMIIRFTKDRNRIDLKSGDNRVVHIQSPIAIPMLNKNEGDNFKIDGIEVYYQILDIINTKGGH